MTAELTETTPPSATAPPIEAPSPSRRSRPRDRGAVRPRRGAPRSPTLRPSGHPAPSRAPKPPRRPPQPPAPPLVLTPKERLIRGGVALAAALLIGFILNLTLVSQLQYAASQQQLRDHFSAQLADGVAPVSEGDLNGVLLDDGVPVAQLQLPSIGLDAVAVEGSSSAVTTTGPGHRRDTALPGQAGTSVIIGRAAAFGGPFSRIQELQPGDTFTVTTGQGEHTFEVMGLRYAGDPSPPRLKPGESRVVLESARGLPFTPTGVARVDARLVGDAVPTGARQTSFASLPPEAKAMSTDTTSVWALVFGLQALVVAELALMWALQRIGPRHTWTVFVPILLLIGLIVTAQIVSLLPNVL